MHPDACVAVPCQVRLLPPGSLGARAPRVLATIMVALPVWCFIKVSCRGASRCRPHSGRLHRQACLSRTVLNLWLEAEGGHRHASWTCAPRVHKTVVCEEFVVAIRCLCTRAEFPCEALFASILRRMWVDVGVAPSAKAKFAYGVVFASILRRMWLTWASLFVPKRNLRAESLLPACGGDCL